MGCWCTPMSHREHGHSHSLLPLQARRRRAWTERALLHGNTPDPHPAGEGADSPKDQSMPPHDGKSLQPEPEQLERTGSAQSGLEAASPSTESREGRDTAAGHDAVIASAARTPEQGARPGRVAAGDSLRRAAIANSRAPKPAADGGADLPEGKALGAQWRAATASEGSEAPKSSAAGSGGVSIAGGRSKTLPAAASPARFAVHARAVPGPPRWSPQAGASGDTRACGAADHAAGAGACGERNPVNPDDVEAQSGGRPFLHSLPTPFSAAAPPAASPGRSRGEAAAGDPAAPPPRPLRQPGQRRAAAAWDRTPQVRVSKPGVPGRHAALGERHELGAGAAVGLLPSARAVGSHGACRQQRRGAAKHKERSVKKPQRRCRRGR